MIWIAVLIGAIAGGVFLGVLSWVFDGDGPIMAFGVMLGAVIGGCLGALVFGIVS